MPLAPDRGAAVDRTPSLPPLSPPVRALLLGVVTGIRSSMAVALLAVETERSGFDPGGRLARRLASPGAVAGALLAAGGELVVDKLSITPSRLSAGPFLGRLVTGGMVGAAVHHDAGHPGLVGVMLGALGAGVGATVATKARTALADRTGVPAPLLGAAEDLVAIGLGLAAVAGRHPTRR
jgi:uncharacterized membrane protein